jgi:hypothetical protein
MSEPNPQLTAEGLSNREIGQKLFVSPRTVSAHLYRTYPKLGISARGELAPGARGHLIGCPDTMKGIGVPLQARRDEYAAWLPSDALELTSGPDAGQERRPPLSCPQPGAGEQARH